MSERKRVKGAGRLVALLVLGCGVIAPAAGEEFPELYNSEKAATQPMTPEEVVASAELPEGFLLSVFAAEPAVQNPIAITTDQRGRLWVAENYTWSGANFGNYDTKLRDRIVILADHDGDGRHDERKVFWDGGRKLTSVEVGFGGVWALNLPYLLFIPDRNHDDVPDGPPEVVLDGLDEDAVGHTPANGLKWGPDGWLYARHGIQATSRIGVPGASDSQRVQINTGIWRYHPTRQKVEAVLHGMTNSWGFDFDARGEMFVINTVIGHLFHLVPGSHVARMYGVDLNPHVYELMEQAADHVHWDTGQKWSDVRAGMTDSTSAAGGGHAHIGLMIYQGDNWPAEYRDLVYTLNLHGQRLNSDRLVPEGAGFKAVHAQDLCFLKDPWYRGMDLITGADGGVYIADWSDTGECHDHDGVHRTSGRIYKLTYKIPPLVREFDLTQMDEAALCEKHNMVNAWWGRQVRKEWQARAARGEPLRQVARWVQEQFALEKSVEERVQALWALAAIGQATDAALLAHLSDPKPEVRSWVVRLLVDRYEPGGEQPTQEVYRELVRLGREDTEGLVQLYLASALQRLSLESRWELAAALASHDTFADDRLLPLLIWYGIEPAVTQNPQRAIALAQSSQLGLVRKHIARRLTLEIEQNPQAVEALLEWANRKPADPESGEIVIGMSDALRGWLRAPAPQGWSEAAVRLAKNSDDATQQALAELGVVFGEGRAMTELRQIIESGTAAPSARQQALRALLVGRSEDLPPLLFRLLADRAVHTEAIRGLALYEHAETPQQLLNHRGLYDPVARGEMINTLASRPAYAKALLAAVRDKVIDAREITAFHARQVRAFDDESLNAALAELWGDVRVSAAEKRAQIDEWRGRLTAAELGEADLPAGRGVFQQTCGNCHVLYGVGRKLGPDLTGSNRSNLDYLLENVFDPSASVGADFKAVNVILADGRIVNGVISAQAERTLTIETAQEPVVIDRREIEELVPTTTSMMPDGILQNLTPQQVRDLFAYLQHQGQVELPSVAAGK
jgi:putative membrane-bound dehydrogenase-like protein